MNLRPQQSLPSKASPKLSIMAVGPIMPLGSTKWYAHPFNLSSLNLHLPSHPLLPSSTLPSTQSLLTPSVSTRHTNPILLHNLRQLPHNRLLRPALHGLQRTPELRHWHSHGHFHDYRCPSSPLPSPLSPANPQGLGRYTSEVLRQLRTPGPHHHQKFHTT